MPEAVKNGDTVRVHYTGRLETGEVFDTSEDGEPLEFKVGSGEVIPGFDEAVRGMEVGGARTVEIEADDAYGQRREQLVATVEREQAQFPFEPQVGMSLMMQLHDGNQIPVTVTEVTDTHVSLDANHPLAGRKLTFDLKLVEHEPAKDEG